jgi:UDP-glucose 4-epimerase
VYGTGEQTRDYVFIDDVVEALLSAATARRVERWTLNIGSGVETTVLGLVRAVERATGREAHVLYNPQEGAGVSRLCADISLARERLDYRPSVGLDEGLRLTLERDPRFSGRHKRR